MNTILNTISQSPKLLDQVRSEIRALHYSLKTEKTYISWIKQYILFHKKRHPLEMGESEINAFLKHLAVDRKVASSTQNQALCAIIFMYKHIFKKDIGQLELIWAQKPKKMPVVFTHQEVQKIISHLKGYFSIMDEILKASQMITEKTLMPGDPGSIKWMKQYGDQLICIRYRYDRKRKVRLKTVELIAEEKPYCFNSRKIPYNKKVKIRVKYGEVNLGRLVREAGGVWDSDQKIWIISYGQVKALGLINRMVQ